MYADNLLHIHGDTGGREDLPGYRGIRFSVRRHQHNNQLGDHSVQHEQLKRRISRHGSSIQLLWNNRPLFVRRYLVTAAALVLRQPR